MENHSIVIGKMVRLNPAELELRRKRMDWRERRKIEADPSSCDLGKCLKHSFFRDRRTERIRRMGRTSCTVF